MKPPKDRPVIKYALSPFDLCVATPPSPHLSWKCVMITESAMVTHFDILSFIDQLFRMYMCCFPLCLFLVFQIDRFDWYIICICSVCSLPPVKISPPEAVITLWNILPHAKASIGFLEKITIGYDYFKCGPNVMIAKSWSPSLAFTFQSCMRYGLLRTCMTPCCIP